MRRFSFIRKVKRTRCHGGQALGPDGGRDAEVPAGQLQVGHHRALRSVMPVSVSRKKSHVVLYSRQYTFLSLISFFARPFSPQDVSPPSTPHLFSSPRPFDAAVVALSYRRRKEEKKNVGERPGGAKKKYLFIFFCSRCKGNRVTARFRSPLLSSRSTFLSSPRQLLPPLRSHTRIFSYAPREKKGRKEGGLTRRPFPAFSRENKRKFFFGERNSWVLRGGKAP